MKKRILLLPFMLLTITACNNSGGGLPQTDITVNNLKYENTVLSFDKVDDATGYSLKLIKNNSILFEDVITKNSIDLSVFNVYGNIEVDVCPLFKEKLGKSSVISIISLKKFDKIFFEAESGCYNIGTGKEVSNYRWNECASDTYYMGGIDDAGQGVYYNLLIPRAGTYELRCHYASLAEYVNAHDDVLVNNVYSGQLHFNEGKGWFGSSPVSYLLNLPVAKINVSLNEGWNTISVFKNGSAADNWGSFAELDYFELIGNGETYNPDVLEKQYGKEPEYYRLEGEMGSPRKLNKESLRRECKNPPIVQKAGESFSNNFVLGSLESDYDGVEWRFKTQKSGKYNLILSYASMEFEGSKKPKPTFVVTQDPIDLDDNDLFDYYKHYYMPQLEYTSSWSTFSRTEEIVLDLEQGVNYIYCLLLDSEDSGYFEIDYADIWFRE